MQTGDRVRFLNAVGGGIVRRFQNKEIVIVEEDDGFETPVLIRECVVVDERNISVNNIPKKTMESSEIPQPAIEKPKPSPPVEITEISGNDRLNVYLAYLPVDIKNLGKTDFEAFLINDSNYFLFFNYMNRQNNAWISHKSEIIEPNTRLFIEEFTKNDLNELEKICIQFIAFKKNKPYSLKNAHSVEIRLDITKFYKLHSFLENDFFEDEALIYPVVTNDNPARELLISAIDLQEAMMQKSKADKPFPKPVKQEKKLDLIEIDLHINQLLETTAKMNNAEILNHQLDVFRRTMDENIRKKGQKIVFIHGKGEGVLRTAVLAELKQKYKHCVVQDASFREYGFGATMVTIK
ncbi:mannonate oxidoreductase [Bacteroidia bacterium]|nr:mannonate oxidoreductase [Bacteroidia bacterium]